MFLHFKVPGNIYLIGPTKESLNIFAKFSHKRYLVQIVFDELEERQEIKLDKIPLFGVLSKAIYFILDDQHIGSGPHSLSELIKKPKHHELLRLIREVAYSVFRAIRNFARVPEFPETFPIKLAAGEDLEGALRAWVPMLSNDGASWTMLLPSAGITDLIVHMTNVNIHRSIPELKNVTLFVPLWPDVVEALEDSREPPPELEFKTNANEHLKQNNFRIAILESIICLEIVLADYLQNYLAKSAKVPKVRIKKFLVPELSLTARLSCLLDLTLHESYLKDINFDDVLKAVNLRNTIIHKTGKLPSGIKETEIKKVVGAVLNLSDLLAIRRDNWASINELKKIKEALYQSGEMLFPQIWLEPRHAVRIDFEFYRRGKFPNDAIKFTSLKDKAIELLKERDSRFEPDKHLTIHFQELPKKSLAWFRYGSLSMSK